MLGAILVNPSGFDHVADTLAAEDFFRRAHAAIFAAMRVVVHEQHGAIDPLTLKVELERVGQMEEVGGAAYIAGLTDGVPRSANVRHYAAIVREAAQRRAVIRVAGEMLTAAYDAEAPARDVIGRADLAIIDLQRLAPARLLDLRQGIPALLGDLESRGNRQGALIGIETGFATLNELTFGWQVGDLVLLAARPSIGKTALALNTGIAAARSGKKVGLFSLEMRRRQLEYRILSHLSGVTLTRILGGYLGEADYEALTPAMATFETLPFFVDDRGGQTIHDIRAACRRMKAEHGLDLVIIDYVQLIPGTLERRGANRNEELTDISRRAKALADEVSVPVLLLSQLSRASDVRGDKRPILSDLRDSGALEQDADLVCFLHRKHHRESGLTAFILEKQRNGPGGTVNLSLNRETQTFTDSGLEPEQPALPDQPSEPKPPRGWRRGPRR